MMQYFMFVVLMIGGKRFDDLVMVQQFQRRACILCQNEIGFFKNILSAKADVLQIADWEMER